MALFTDLPDEILLSIFQLISYAAERDRSLSMFNMSYVNNKFCSLALEVHYGERSSNWTKKVRKRKVTDMRKAEAQLIFDKVTSPPHRVVDTFERGRRVLDELHRLSQISPWLNENIMDIALGTRSLHYSNDKVSISLYGYREVYRYIARIKRPLVWTGRGRYQYE